MLKHHLTTAHYGNANRQCATCNHKFSNLRADEIDLTHYEMHGKRVYNCLFCVFSASATHQMHEHLSDSHATKLPYYLVRAVKECDSSDTLIVCRLQDIRNDEFTFSQLSESQINYMSPLLSEYVSNADPVPYEESSLASTNKDDFMASYQKNLKINDHTEKLYRFQTLMADLSESMRTLGNFAEYQEQHDLNLNAPDEPLLYASTSSGATSTISHEASIQKEIDHAAMCLVTGTGLDENALFKCSVCADLTLDRRNFGFHASSHGNSYICHHCGINMGSIHLLTSHIVEHGEHRFFCYYCSFTTASESKMAGHFDTIHRNKQIQYVPLNPSGNDRQKDLFVVCPRSVKTVDDFGVRLMSRYNDQLMCTKKVFSPEDIHLLPQQSIYSTDVECKQCSYKTKVRTNMQRHLQLNKCAEGMDANMGMSTVNPVPCLDSIKKHSDKMKNLAASSNEIDATDPKYQFVPDKLRYKCGVASCQFHALTEKMLQQHIDVSHALDKTFTCPHCKTELQSHKLILNAGEILDHLRYHDSMLYRCSLCKHAHYDKQTIESHMVEYHPSSDKRLITMIRGETNPAIAAEANKATTIKWKCNICTKGIYDTRQQVKKHLNLSHRLSFQYQCSVCPYQSDGKETITAHLTSNHKAAESNMFETCFEEVESDVDNTPIWRRDDPKRVSTTLTL